MIEWSVDIQVFKPLPSFEIPLHIEVETQADSNYCHKGHFHQSQKHMIILYTYSGQGQFQDGKGTYDLNPGDCLLCNPGNPEICYRYPPKNKDPWRFLWLGFTGGSTQEKARDLWDSFGPIFQLSFSSKIIKRLEYFQTYDSIIYEMSPFEGAALIIDVFSELGKSMSTQLTPNPNNILIQKTNDLINRCLNEKISITQIARSLHVSREHLSRVFKKGTGYSLKQYVLQRKIRMACKLLKETNMSIKQIAARLGFMDQANFSKTFQNHMDMTPRDFRKSDFAMIL